MLCWLNLPEKTNSKQIFVYRILPKSITDTSIPSIFFLNIASTIRFLLLRVISFVFIARVVFSTRTKTQTIPFDTVDIDSPLLKIGDTEVQTEGVDGTATVTITDRYEDGILVSSTGGETVVVEPVNKVIAHGTAIGTPYSKREGDYKLENGIPTEYAYVLNGKVTAYYAPEGSGTYSGRPLVIGSVGVDPDVIPYGSELYIVSEDGSHVYGYAVASDTGYIKGTGIVCDAYMGTTYEDCLWWQAQYCNVYVLSVGDNSVFWG